MDGGARFTEDTVDDRGFSAGGFLIDEPSNKPLKLSIGRRRPPAAERQGVRRTQAPRTQQR
jgi:hypothetical protein